MSADAPDGRNRKDGRYSAQPGEAAPSGYASHSSYSSHSGEPPSRIIPPRGDYQTLLSFQKAETIYDLTFNFAHRYLAKGDRTIDQMIQAARSGKKNILEGSKAGRISKEMELKLTGVARSSLEELLDDYRDYLRARGLTIWQKNSKEALYVRKLGCQNPQSFELYKEFFETRPPDTTANIAICLIHQTNYLLDQQLLHLEKEFMEQGGLKERMSRARREYRRRGGDEGAAGK